MRNDDPAGMSGSLVWNTRYVELTQNQVALGRP